MLEPGDSVYEDDVYGVEQLESNLRDGDSAFREIVRILMDEDNPPDDDRGPRSLSQHRYGHDEGHWSSREYAQLIRDGIFCLSFIAVLLSVLIIIILRGSGSPASWGDPQEGAELAIVTYKPNMLGISGPRS